jgi:hypothetical protein
MAKGRPERVLQLFKLYQKHYKSFDVRQRRRNRRLRQRQPVPSRRPRHISSLSSLSSLSELSGQSESDGSFWDDVDSISSFTSTDSSTASDSSDDRMPELADLADDEDSDDEDMDDERGSDRWSRLRRWIQEQIDEMYENRYEMPRDTLPRGPARLPHVLYELKTLRPDKFRETLRVTPATFDALAQRIGSDPVFSNNSNNDQIPVPEQLAIALYRFGHDGNAASLQSVADWAGIAKGTVLLCTRRVMTAVLRQDFRDEAVHMPEEEEKNAAKDWVEQHSCRGWRGGWCFVDGTLIPLYSRPAWYGESYFDRKCRYSLNVQVSFVSSQL